MRSSHYSTRCLLWHDTETGVGYQVSGVRCQVPGYQVSGVDAERRYFTDT